MKAEAAIVRCYYCGCEVDYPADLAEEIARYECPMCQMERDADQPDWRE